MLVSTYLLAFVRDEKSGACESRMSRQTESVRPPEAESTRAGAATGRMPAEERRLQIVSIAMRLFSERGFRGTTTKEIAQVAGVSEAIIFRHFANKEELYAAIIDCKACAGGARGEDRSVAEAIQVSVADAMARKDDRAVFQSIAAHMMRHHTEDTEFLRLLFYSALEGHQLSQMFWDRNVRLLYEFLGAYIGQRQLDGVFRPLDPVVAVRAFTGMIIHHSVTAILWDTSRSLLDIPDEAAASEFTEIFLRGIAAHPSAPGQEERPDASPTPSERASQLQERRAPRQKKRK